MMRYTTDQRLSVLMANDERAVIQRIGGMRILLTVVDQYDGSTVATWDSDYNPSAFGEPPCDFLLTHFPGYAVPDHLQQGRWEQLAGRR